MVTTIQISETTHHLLETIKEQSGATTFDAVVERLARKDLDVPQSMYGIHKDMRWRKSDRMQLREF